MTGPISPHNEGEDEPGMPRSLKVFLAVVGVFVVGFVALHLAGYGLHGH